MSHNKVIGEGLTYDDVLLLPGYSEVLPREVDLSTRLTGTIRIAYQDAKYAAWPLGRSVSGIKSNPRPLTPIARHTAHTRENRYLSRMMR